MPYLTLLMLFFFQYHQGAVIFLPAHPASFVQNFVSEMQCFYFNESQDAIVLQLDSLIWETASPRIHRLKIIHESLRMSNSLDPDQAQHSVGPVLGPNFFKGCQQTTKVVASGQRAKYRTTS